MKLFNQIFFGLLCLLMAGLFVTSCNDEPLPGDDGKSSTNAELMTESQIQSTYSWYTINVNNYQPNASVISEIKNLFKPDEHKFLVYFKPTCACKGTMEQFPMTMKILHDAGIPTTNYSIYGMLSATTSFPEQDLFLLRDLPTVMVVKNGTALYSVLDSLKYSERVYKDTLLIEEYIKKALK